MVPVTNIPPQKLKRKFWHFEDIVINPKFEVVTMTITTTTSEKKLSKVLKLSLPVAAEVVTTGAWDENFIKLTFSFQYISIVW